MDTRKLALLTAIAISQLPGCSGFDIYKNKPGTKAESISGIPFYKKIGVDMQTTVYTRTWFDVHFILEDVDQKNPDKGKNKREGNLSFSELQWDDVKAAAANNLAVKVAEYGCPLETIIESYKNTIGIAPLAMKTIADESNINKSVTSSGLNESIISNVTKQETVVDYDDVYYYNVMIPLFGTANATLKLAGDGTLTDATTNVDTTKLAEEIPLGEFLTKKLHLEQPTKEEAKTAIKATGKSVPKEFAECKSQAARRLTIDRKEAGYVYTVSRRCRSTHGENVPGVADHDCGTAILLAPANAVSITRTVFGEGEKKEEKEKEPNTTTFSGSLVLPEAKDKSP